MKTHETEHFAVNLKNENSAVLCICRDRDSRQGTVLMDGDADEVLTLLGMAVCEVLDTATKEGMNRYVAISSVWTAFEAGITAHKEYDKEVQ